MAAAGRRPGGPAPPRRRTAGTAGGEGGRGGPAGGGAQNPSGSGEERELAGRGTHGLAVFPGQRFAAGPLERGGDVIPGIRERTTQDRKSTRLNSSHLGI